MSVMKLDIFNLCSVSILAQKTDRNWVVDDRIDVVQGVSPVVDAHGGIRIRLSGNAGLRKEN